MQQVKQLMMMMMTSVMMIVVMVITGVDHGHLRILGRIEVVTRFVCVWFIMFVQFMNGLCGYINQQDKQDNHHLKKNYEFYTNQRRSEPNGMAKIMH